MSDPAPVSEPPLSEPPLSEPPLSEPPLSEQCDQSTTCLACGAPMREEHAHYRCPECGWRDSCCDGPY